MSSKEEEPRSRRLQELLRKCAAARRALAPDECLAAAKQAVQVDPYSIRARRNVCWALFALKRYEECQTACRNGANMISRLEYEHIHSEQEELAAAAAAPTY